MIGISKEKARQFLLLKQGLIDDFTFRGKEGVMEYITKVGCIQYDPVDVCGKNVDILLNSRIKGYTKNLLNELLYGERRLIDYFDKNLSIFPIEDFPILLDMRVGGGYAEGYDRRGGEEVRQIEPLIRRLIEEKGYISASEIEIDKTIEWHWGVMTSIQRAALESMYFRGELIIHHKTGTNKSYAFMKDYVPNEILKAELPYSDDIGRVAWFIERRIKSIGLLWNKASDAWLGIRIKANERNEAFRYLLNQGRIEEVNIEGLGITLYITTGDLPILERVLGNNDFIERTELIAPLDNMMWDRKLIKALFDFEYKWEIYTPAAQRKFGAYVLPILHGDRFIGRVEIVRNKKEEELYVKNIWYEEATDISDEVKASIHSCFIRFATLNNCKTVSYNSEEWINE